MQGKQNLILSKDGDIYDFTVLKNQENNEESFEVKTKNETSSNEFLSDTILQLSNELSKLRVQKVHLSSLIVDNYYHFPANTKKSFDFNYDMKSSASVEFILEFQLMIHANQNPILKIYIEYENLDTSEKASILIYFCNFCYQMGSCQWVTQSPFKTKHVVDNFKRGNYKMKLIFDLKDYEIYLYYYKLFMKIRNRL